MTFGDDELSFLADTAKREQVRAGLRDIAVTVRDAHNAFLAAGFSERQAFKLALEVLITVMDFETAGQSEDD